MNYKVTAIAMGYVNYRENDRILRLFSRERGLINAKARGCRKKMSSLASASEQFVYGEYEIFRNNNKDTIDSANVSESFYAIREDYEKLLTATKLIKMTMRVINEEEKNERLFTLLYLALCYLTYGDMENADILAVYALKLADATGVRPKITECAHCNKSLLSEERLFFSKELGGAICLNCARAEASVSKLTMEAMRRILLLDDEKINIVKLKPETSAEILKLISAFLEWQTGESH
ncbi:MAG: DNA repair protein RecO [Clostridia bacterium]